MRKEKGILIAVVIGVVILSNAMAMGATEKMHLIYGQVKKVDTGADTVAVLAGVKDKEKEFTFHLAPQASLNDQGKKIILGDLKEGSRVALHYTHDNGKLMAHSISIRNQSSMKSEKY
jgi:Cu/Ag efflux protein CusF